MHFYVAMVMFLLNKTMLILVVSFFCLVSLSHKEPICVQIMILGRSCLRLSLQQNSQPSINTLLFVIHSVSGIYVNVVVVGTGVPGCSLDADSTMICMSIG